MFSLFNKVKPTTFFVFAALLLEVLFNLVTPPLQAPDELNHFYRAYQVADGHFLPETRDNRLGGQMPLCFKTFVLPYTFAATNFKYTFNKKDIVSSFKVSFNQQQKEFKDFPNTAYYSPVCYLPQAFAITILKHFNCPVALLYYGGRAFMFMFWLACMFFAIKLIPIGKWLFTLIILLPMNLYIANSFSADAVTNCLAIFFIAFVLKLVFSEDVITKKQLFFVLLLVCLLALAKLVYAGAILLLFLISAKKFKNKVQYFASVSLLLLATFLTAFLWSDVVMRYYIPFSKYNTEFNMGVGLSPCGNYYLQKEYILHHGAYFFKVLFNSVFDHPRGYLFGYIGAFGQSDIALPPWLYAVSYLVIITIAVGEINKFSFTFSQKLIILFAAGLSFILLLLSQHLIWDCVGEGVVDLLQGRYLIPIAPLLFLVMQSKKLKLKVSPLFIIVPFLVLIYSYSFYSIYDRFFKESFESKVEYYCDAEFKGDFGLLGTNNANINVDGAALQTSREHRSGRYSILLTPEAHYGFSYKFWNTHRGDMIEMEAWEKGGRGVLVLSGKSKTCGDFFLSKKEATETDSNGWSKIHHVITITQNCDDSEIIFYVWNMGDATVYFDDVKFCIKKYPNAYLY